MIQLLYHIYIYIHTHILVVPRRVPVVDIGLLLSMRGCSLSNHLGVYTHTCVLQQAMATHLTGNLIAIS